MLTRPQFDTACKALIDKYAGVATDSVATSPLKGWSWNEHPSYPNFGCMSRTVTLFHRPDNTTGDIDDSNERLEEPDPSIVSVDPGSDETVVCQQHVVFSSTFRVPAFYFTLCNSGGAPLPLPDIVKSSLFKSIVCDNGFEVSSYAISLPTSTFPLLSHGDHPTLGSPCWYFHPCETSAALEELLAEVKEGGWDEKATLVRQLELWFMMLCSVVNL